MTEINNLLNEENTDCSAISCPKCNKSEFVMWDRITTTPKHITADFICTGCGNTFIKSIHVEIKIKHIPQQFLFITEAKD